MTEPFNPQRRSLLHVAAIAAVAVGTAKATSVHAAQEISAMSTLPAFQSQSPYIYNDLTREHLLRTGSLVLHEYYFDNLGGVGQAGAAQRTHT